MLEKAGTWLSIALLFLIYALYQKQEPVKLHELQLNSKVNLIPAQALMAHAKKAEVKGNSQLAAHFYNQACRIRDQEACEAYEKLCLSHQDLKCH